jgi:hypothetical protein
MRKTALRTIGVKNQVTIPPWMVREIGGRSGDYLELLPRKEEQAILLRLVRPAPLTEEGYSEGDLAALRQLVDNQEARGEYTRYGALEGALQHLDSIASYSSKTKKRKK